MLVLIILELQDLLQPELELLAPGWVQGQGRQRPRPGRAVTAPAINNNVYWRNLKTIIVCLWFFFYLDPL